MNQMIFINSYFRRDKLWIAMELCSGGSMQDIYHSLFSYDFLGFITFEIVLAYGSLSEVQIGYILKETLKGLDYLHKNGKMHRDVKVKFLMKSKTNKNNGIIKRNKSYH